MRANEMFNIKLEVEKDICIFTGRILYWWEEQNIKIDSVYEEPTSKKLSIDNSKIFINTVNKFLITIESNNKIINKEKLHELAIEKNHDVEWSDIMHHSVTIPLYDAYIDISGSSMSKMQEFRKKVMAVYEKNLRAEGFTDFPLPSELIEYDFLSLNGVLTRNDLLNMSYAELLKYQTIREIDNRYHKKNSNQGVDLGTNQPHPILDFKPDYTLIPAPELKQTAKQFFPDVVL